MRSQSWFSISSRGARYFEFAYVLFLPITVWFLYRFSPFNNAAGWLDAWVYFGYIHNFQDLIDRYGLPYYSTRFGLIFPNLLLVQILGPIKGYLAFIYLMYLVAGVPLYLLFRKHYSVHAAVLAYAILVSSAWFARTVLWTHPDASAVPYLIAALMLIFLEPRHRRTTNFVIGVLIAMAVNSNVFAFSIGGLIGIAYVSYFWKVLWSSMRHDVPWILAGFALVFMAGSAGYFACCGHSNYLANTFEMIKWSTRGGGKDYMMPGIKLLHLHYLYLPPFLAVLTYVLPKEASVESVRLLRAVTYYLIAVIAFVVLYQFTFSAALLELFYYFSFFLVPCIVCIALILVILARAGNSTWLVNLALAAFLLPALLIVYVYPAILDRVPAYWVALSFIFTILLFLLANKYKKVIPLAIVFLSISSQLSILSGVTGPMYSRMYGASAVDTLSRYRLGLKFIETMPKFREEKIPIFFWYANADQLAHSLQATYLWGYSRVFDSAKGTKGLPSLKGANMDLLKKQEKSSLVLFDRDERTVNEGVEELRRVGLRFSIKKTQEICEQNICYTIVVLDVDGSPEKVAQEQWQEGRGQLLSVASDWSGPVAGAKLEQNGPIVSVVTHPKAWNYGAVASMVFTGGSPLGSGWYAYRFR